MKKILSILICSYLVLCATEQVEAQAPIKSFSKHEVSVHGGFGLSTLDYSLTGGERSSKSLPNFGLGYNYFFNEKFAIGSGIELAFYNSDAKIKQAYEAYYKVDNEKDRFRLTADIKGYDEQQKSIFINIPITAMFQTKLSGEHKFFVVAGGKIAIPVKSTYKSYTSVLTTTGHYFLPNEGGIDLENIPSKGFGTFEGVEADEKVDFRPVFMLTTEIGVKWSLGSSTSLYTGINFDYGLSNAIKNTDRHLIDFNSKKPETLGRNSVLGAKNFANEATPIFLGVKLRLAFDPERWFK